MAPPAKMVHLEAKDLERLLPMRDAIDVIWGCVDAGVDSIACPPRSSVAAGAGAILTMPAADAEFTGIKIVSVSPESCAGLPRVQGIYVLFGNRTLSPVATMDGVALTALRTPAVSAAAMRRIAPLGATRLLVYGTGVQAWGHVVATAAVRPISHVAVASRDPDRRERFLTRVSEFGLTGSHATADDIAEADVICCCTTATTPLFDGRKPKSDCAIVAVGSHEPLARETDNALIERSTVIVESIETARREAGDIAQPMDEGLLAEDDLIDLHDLAKCDAIPYDRPRFFKSTGMAWEDLCLASSIFKRWQES